MKVGALEESVTVPVRLRSGRPEQCRRTPKATARLAEAPFGRDGGSRTSSHYLLNVADTANGWPPGSGLIQLNDVEIVDPDKAPVLKFIWFEPNVIVPPDSDHEPVVPDV
jgi:hypothetical protein